MERFDEKLDYIMHQVTETRIELTKMAADVERNTDDLEEHMRRTNLLESHMLKMKYALMVGAGVGLALYGPDFVKLLQVIL